MYAKYSYGPKKQDHGFTNGKPEIEGHSYEEIGFHIYLMGQAGLVCTADTTTSDDESPDARLMNITWDGYEFLSATKDESLWIKARSKFFDGAASFTFDLVKKWLEGQIG